MTMTANFNERLTAANMTADERARALQAAYVGAALTDALAATTHSVAKIYRRWRDWAERRRSIDYLERMDERLLADIGLSRATLEDTLRRGTPMPANAHAAPAVEAVITETATIGTAANQDHGPRRKAA